MKLLGCIPLARNLGTTGEGKSTQGTLTESTFSAEYSLSYGNGERYQTPSELTRSEFVHTPFPFHSGWELWEGRGINPLGK